jgi:hypothetical protein
MSTAAAATTPAQATDATAAAATTTTRRRSSVLSTEQQAGMYVHMHGNDMHDRRKNEDDEMCCGFVSLCITTVKLGCRLQRHAAIQATCMSRLESRDSIGDRDDVAANKLHAWPA